MTASRFVSYRVRVTTADDVFDVVAWGKVNSEYCFNQWRKQLGKSCVNVALIGVDASGEQHMLEEADLRSDLHAGVKAAPPQAEQLRLL